MYLRTLFAASAIAIVGAAAQAEQMSNEQLMSELQSLRSEVNQLRAAQGDAWMTERRAEEVKTLVREVLADADTRASLMDSAITAGHNGSHFFLASEDGNFQMNLYGQIQVRYTWNLRQTDKGGTDDQEAGFSIPRAKVGFAGHVINPRLHYDVRFNVNTDDNEVRADKVVIGYDVTDTVYVWAGEDKAPFLREELIDSAHQLAVDRSVVNQLFTMGIAQGIGVKWNAHDQVKVAAMWSDGTGSGDSRYEDTYWVGDLWPDYRDTSSKMFDDDATDFAVTGRVDVLLAGDWAQWKDFTSWPGEELFVALGGAVNYEVGETGDSTDNDNWLSWTIDATAEYQGWALSVMYVGAATQYEEPGAAGDFDPWGLVAQLSYNYDLGNKTSIEPFVRYEYIDFDDFGDGDIRTGSGVKKEVSLLTFGGNWYNAKHAAKLTVDCVWAMDPLDDKTGGIFDDNRFAYLGILEDDSTNDGQLAFRVQYQLLF